MLRLSGLIQIPHWPVSAGRRQGNEDTRNRFKFLIGRFQRRARLVFDSASQNSNSSLAGFSIVEAYLGSDDKVIQIPHWPVSAVIPVT